ncbi:hypothetical protein FB451DRAFT_1207772 [Mycena latifolia]|nr:hypothetical protein FB451DRAFT_1207772 [Mycena latifolia]
MDPDPGRSFPNEIWMTCFQRMDRATLKSVRLACHVFASLAWDVLLRDITWHRPATMLLAHARHWGQNPVLHRDLSVCLEHRDDNYHGNPGLTRKQVEHIFKRIRSFSNLETLTLRCLGGHIPENLFAVLRELPNLRALIFVGGNIPANLVDMLRGLPSLTHLTFDFCALTPALAELPAPSEYTSNITDLKIRLGTYPWGLVQPWNPQTVPCAGLFSLLPGLRALHIEDCFLPTEILASGITSLTIGVPHTHDSSAIFYAEAHLCKVLRSMPQLTRLTAYLRPVNTSGAPHHQFNAYHGFVTLGEPPRLPHLTHFSGTARLGQLALVMVPELENVRVTAQGNSDAIEFIQFLQKRRTLVRHISVELPFWSSTVARILLCLPRCERREIVYAGTDSDQGKFDLSTSHILEDVVIQQAGKPAIDFIEFLAERKAPVRRLAVALPCWSIEVVRVVALSLRQCEHLEITYAGGELSDDESIADLGIEFLPLLPHLREISILRVPPMERPHGAPENIDKIAQNMASGPDIEAGDNPLIQQNVTAQTEVVRTHEELVELEDTEDEMNISGILYCWTRYNHNPAFQRICLSGTGPTKWVRALDRDISKWITKVI